MSSRKRARVGFAAVVLILGMVAPAFGSSSGIGVPDPDAGPARSPVPLLQATWRAAAGWLGPLLGVVVAADGEEDPDDPFGGPGGDPGGGTGILDPNGGSGSGGSGGGGS